MVSVGINSNSLFTRDGRVKGAGAAARDDRDLSRGTAAVFRDIAGTKHVKFGDGIDGGVGQQGEIGAAIDIVGAVDGPVVLRVVGCC